MTRHHVPLAALFKTLPGDYRLMVGLAQLGSFDDLVGEDRWWHGEAKRIRGREIDDQLERGRLLDRQIGRIGALEGLLSAKGDFPRD